MILATDNYPFLEVFWTMLIFFAFVVWIWILFTVLADIFRRHDTSAFAKVLWIIFIIIIPYFGVFVYLIAEHNGMTERAIKQQEAAKSQMDQYVQSVVGKTDPAEQIAKAKGLLDSGTITQAEFDCIKQRRSPRRSASNSAARRGATEERRDSPPDAGRTPSRRRSRPGRNPPITTIIGVCVVVMNHQWIVTVWLLAMANRTISTTSTPAVIIFGDGLLRAGAAVDSI